MITNFIFLLLFLLPTISAASAEKVFLKENFDNLNDWEPLYFPKIARHSTYTIVSQGEGKYLKAESSASASGLIYKKTFNVTEFPNVRWRWKVNTIYQKGDAKTKTGDDYPLRVYVIFEYNPQKVKWLEKVKYESAKILYGKYPPHSSLNYIWANKNHAERVITSSYTDKSKMILLQRGIFNTGKWQTETVDIRQDYQAAFGESPPPTGSIALMNDSDNTGESSVSYLDELEIYRK